MKPKKSGIRENKIKEPRSVLGLDNGQNKWRYYGAILLFVFSFLLYLNTVQNDYTTDDIFVTPQNELVHEGIRAIPEILTTPYAKIDNVSFEYRPIVKITYAIEAQFFGDNPHVSHIIQAFLYGLCCLFLFLFLIKILPAVNILLPLATVLLFAAHPLHTEVVAGLKNRDELLCFIFSLGVLYFLVKAWTENKKSWYINAFLLFFLSFITKPSSVILIVWAPLLLYYLVPTKKYWTLAIISGGLISVCLIAVLAINTWILHGFFTNSSRVIQYSENPLTDIKDATIHVGVIFNSLGFYLSKIIFPYSLGWFYGYNTIALDKPWNLAPAISFIVHCSLFGWAIYGLRKRALYSLAILLYLSAIAPFINVIGPFPGIVAERVVFFASLGFCLGLAILILKLSGVDIIKTSPKIKPLFSVILVAILLLYSVKVVSRNMDWKDNLTLFAKDAAYLDKSVTEHEKYGGILQKTYHLSDNPQRDAWMLEEALKQYKRAIEIYPNSPESWSRIGEILAAEYDKPQEAMPYYKKALEIMPNYARFHFDIAYCYELRMRYDSAIYNYKAAMRLDSSYTDAWQNLSVLYSKLGKNDSAIIYNQVLLNRDINSEHGNANMGFFYKKMGDYPKAIFYFDRALKINPQRTDVAAALDSLRSTR